MESSIDIGRHIKKSTLSLGVISDTHGQLNENIINSLQECDVIVHAGDIGNASVIHKLRKFTEHVFPVRGNNDVDEKWPIEDRKLLNTIPESAKLKFKDEIIALTHGHQFHAIETRHYKLRESFPDASIIIYGHSHRLVCDREQTPWVINPCAGGYNRTFGGASCVVMNYSNCSWTIEEKRTNS